MAYAYYSCELEANESQKYPGIAGFFRILDNSSENNDIDVSFNGESKEKFLAGTSIAMPINSVTLYNDSAETITIVFVQSDDPVDDSRLTLTGAVDVKAADQIFFGKLDIDVLGAGDCRIPARAGRKSILIANTGTENLKVRDAFGIGTSPTGYPLDYGETMGFDVESEFYFYKNTSPSGTQLIDYIEVY